MGVSLFLYSIVNLLTQMTFFLKIISKQQHIYKIICGYKYAKPNEVKNEEVVDWERAGQGTGTDGN